MRLPLLLAIVPLGCDSMSDTGAADAGADLRDGHFDAAKLDVGTEETSSVATTDPCAGVGCAQPPVCSTGCLSPCGCCPCHEGETLITEGGTLSCVNSCFDELGPPEAGP